MSYPWSEPPENFQPFDFAGVIDTPAISGPLTDSLVLSFQVPRGFDGVVKDLSHNVTGGGFVEGSGDLVWRLRVDNQYVKNYGRITVQFGTIAEPRATYGIVLRSGQTFRYLVANAAYGVGGTKIVCSARGWFYPRVL